MLNNTIFSLKNGELIVAFPLRIFLARKWMEAGPIGLAGAAVLPVFAREISEFEQELAPVQSQVKMGSIVMKETVLSKWTAWVSADNGIERFSFECRKNQNQRNYSSQSQRTQTINWTIQNLKQLLLAIQREARESTRKWARIGFGFIVDWIKNWREFFEPITKRSNSKPMQTRNYFQHSIENGSNLDITLRKS